MHGEISGSFPDYNIFICKFKTDEHFFFHETFLVYKMETFKNCKEVKHIMIMIIDSDFLSYVVFDQQLKITQHPPPLKIKKVQVPPFCEE